MGMNDFLIRALIIILWAIWMQKSFGFRKFSFVYLSIMPGVMFFYGDLKVFVFGLVAAGSVFKYLKSGEKRWVWALLALFVLGGLIFGLRVDLPRTAAEIGLINQQRGEHLLMGEKSFAKLMHNKLDLWYFSLERMEERVGVVALFAGAKYETLTKALPIGFLFWWDLIFLVKAILRKLNGEFNLKKTLFVGLFLLVSLLGIGFLSGEIVSGLVLGVVSFVSLLILEEMNQMKENHFRLMLTLDGVVVLGLVYLVNHFTTAV